MKLICVEQQQLTFLLFYNQCTMRKICGYILSLIFGLSFRFWINPSLYSSSVNTHFCCQQNFTFCLSALEADSQCLATLTWNHCVVNHIHCPEYCEVNNHSGICFMFSVEVEKFFWFFWDSHCAIQKPSALFELLNQLLIHGSTVTILVSIS